MSSLQIVLNDIEAQVPLHLRPVRRMNADHKTVYIFRPDQAPEQLIEPSSITGEGPIAGFKLELEDIFAGL